jgi:hypothetical protein
MVEILPNLVSALDFSKNAKRVTSAEETPVGDDDLVLPTDADFAGACEPTDVTVPGISPW